VAAFGLLATAPIAFAGTISGTVTNKTTNKPSVGDKVTLLSLSSSMDELTSTKTDSSGHYQLTTPSDAPYLVKVDHQKGAYFKNMAPGAATADVVVYDVATKVEGVSTEADVLRIEADNGQLKITENYFVKNVSSPPRTQSSEHTYEVVLPPEAVLEGAATVGPSNMPISATPDPVSPKGHYAFSFPIRPNEGESGTRFQLSYHLPYSGSYKFTAKEIQGADNVAIMLPKSMKFEAAGGASFQPVPDDVNAQTLLTRGVKAGATVQFTVSGTGSLPRDAQPAQGGAAGGGGTAMGAQGDTAAAAGGPGGTPGGGLGNPIDTPDPLSKYKYWILGGLVLILAGAAAFFLRKPAGSSVGAAPVLPAVPAASGSFGEVKTAGPSFVGSSLSKSQLLLEALKEELFAIESERIAGQLTSEEYTDVKGALEKVLRRALSRQ
jgi:hypothetical protein